MKQTSFSNKVLPEAGDTCCISSGKPLERETMCQALRVIGFLEHQVKILQSRVHSGPDLMVPSLFM